MLSCEYTFHGEGEGGRDAPCQAVATHYVNQGIYGWRGRACRRHAVQLAEEQLRALKSGDITPLYSTRENAVVRVFRLRADDGKDYETLREINYFSLDDKNRLPDDLVP